MRRVPSVIEKGRDVLVTSGTTTGAACTMTAGGAENAVKSSAVAGSANAANVGTGSAPDTGPNNTRARTVDIVLMVHLDQNAPKSSDWAGNPSAPDMA